MLLGPSRVKDLDIRISVRGGGHVSQIYAIRQALSKGIVAFNQKCKQNFEQKTTKDFGCVQRIFLFP